MSLLEGLDMIHYIRLEDLRRLISIRCIVALIDIIHSVQDIAPRIEWGRGKSRPIIMHGTHAHMDPCEILEVGRSGSGVRTFTPYV
jgi:hypothetical protein